MIKQPVRFFFRNRPELELLVRLLDQFPARFDYTDDSSSMHNKEAEAYSFAYVISTKRPDLNPRICAVDISRCVMEIGEAGIYPLDMLEPSLHVGFRSIFERMSHSTRRTCLNKMGKMPELERGFRTESLGAWGMLQTHA